MITWRSGKQGVTAQSSTEAEYIAMWEAGKEASWLRNLHEQLQLTQKEPIMIMCNNTEAVEIAKKPVVSQKNKTYRVTLPLDKRKSGRREILSQDMHNR